MADAVDVSDLESAPAGSARLLFVKTFWQLLLGSVLIAGGIVAIFLGWFGASGTNQVWAQIPYVISGGLLGLGLVFAGAALVFAFYLARLNLVTEGRLRAIETALKPIPAPADDAPTIERPSAVVALSAGTKFHRPDCTLVAGKPGARSMTPSQASRKGLEPCGVCEPA